MRHVSRAIALALAVALASATALAACSGIAAPSITPAPTASSTPAPAKTLDPRAALEASFESTIFMPAFRLRMPATWFGIERDDALLQVWLDEEKYEITFDTTYRHAETVEAAIARLRATSGLNPGETAPLTVGGRAGLTFVADPAAAVKFTDSGFHTNAAGRLRVTVVPTDAGQTITIFVTTADPAGFGELDEIALRILASVEWTGASAAP